MDIPIKLIMLANTKGANQTSKALSKVEKSVTKVSVEYFKQAAAAEKTQRIQKTHQKTVEAGVKRTSKVMAKEANVVKKQVDKTSRVWAKHYKTRDAQLRRSTALVKKMSKKTEDANKKAASVKYLQKGGDFDRDLASTRYAMYDIGRRALVAGAAIATGFAVATKAAIDFESAFTSVERTSEVTLNSNIPEVRLEAEILRDALIQLSVDLPVAFEDIAEIATLGAQLGLAANELDGFTESVAKFSAITGISVETVALSFGRLAELMDVPASKFENLSSAIAFTGINAVATDAEILKMAESISAATSVAGLAADETVGLASALASLKVRPQAARGVLTRLFRNFDLAVSESGSKLDDLGTLIGLTSLESTKLWEQDPSKFFQDFITGAKATGELNSTLKALGVVNVRELDVIQRLSANMPVLTDALADTKEQFELGTYSSEAYALVVDDVAAKITKMQNSIAALGASFGDLLTPALAPVIDMIAGFANWLRETNPLVRVTLAAIGALAGGLLLFFASMAFGIAGLLAMKLALQNLGKSGLQAGIGIGTFKALLLSMLPVQAAVTTMSGAMTYGMKTLAGSIWAATGAAKAFYISLGALGIITTVAAAIIGFNEAARQKEKDLKKLSDAALEAAGGFEAFVDASEKGLQNGEKIYGSITLSLKELTKEEVAAKLASLNANVQREKTRSSTEEGADAFQKAKDKLKEFNNEIQRNKDLNESGDPKGEAEIVITESAKQLMVDSLAEVTGKDGEKFSLFDSLSAEIPPGLEAKLKENEIELSDIVVKATEIAANGGNASAYWDTVMEELYNSKPDSRIFDFLVELSPKFLIPDSVEEYAGVKLPKIINDFTAGFKQIDLILPALKDSLSADAYEDYIRGTNEATKTVGELNDELRETVDALTSEALSENSVSDALTAFADSARDTAGELDGMGSAAKINLKNFATFMDEATEASIEAGEKSEGAFRRILQGLVALDEAGINTKDAFAIAKEGIIDSLVKIGDGYDGLKTKLEGAIDLQGMKDAIKALFATRISWENPADLPSIFALRRQRDELLAEFNSGDNVIEMGDEKDDPVGTGKALTALEKLLAMLEKLYKPSTQKLGALEAVSSLGEALEKNGKTFTDWTDAGMDNMSTMQDTINSLADSSDGNTQVFANSLGALRAALVKVGVSGAGLKQIDQAIKANGVSAKVSKNQTKQFYAQLADTDSAKRALLQIADAIGEVQSAISAGLSATFAQGRAIDDVTLGWLDLTDAQDGARKSIESANDAIVEANQSIQEANDSINELTADSGKLEYQLQIAIKYGDTLRADAIRAELDKIDTEIASKEKDITDANKAVVASQDEIAKANSKLGINSTTRDIIDQNRALQDMAGKYGVLAAHLITTAEPGADLTAIIDKQVEAFKQNAIQMGYTQTEAQDVADVLRTELIASMDEIPDNIRTIIEAETDKALTKVKKFAKDANTRLDSIRDKTITVTTIEKSIQAKDGRNFKGYSYGTLNAATGGMIRGPGTGTSDSIPARLSDGEFVMKAAAVKHYGPDFFNSLNQMKSSSAPMNRSSAPAAGNNTVYLSTEDRQLLRSAIDRPISLYTDNATIAKSANSGNTLFAQRGIR